MSEDHAPLEKIDRRTLTWIRMEQLLVKRRACVHPHESLTSPVLKRHLVIDVENLMDPPFERVMSSTPNGEDDDTRRVEVVLDLRRSVD